MFSLSRDLVDSIEFKGVEYKVDMSFDNILRLSELLQDDSLSDSQQIAIGVKMLFDHMPNLSDGEIVELFTTSYKKLIGNDEGENIQFDIKGNPMPVNRQRDADGELTENVVPFDLEQDAEYIFSSFFQCYGIDLIEEQGKMHWYKFKALLGGLSNDTKFKEVIKIRTDPLPTGKGVAKQVEEMKKLKKAYALKPKGGGLNG